MTGESKHRGQATLALHCHLELRAALLERCSTGNATEFAAAALSAPDLRRANAIYGVTLEAQRRRCLPHWRAGIGWGRYR